MGDGVWARGDSGMLPADLQRAERYWRWSFGERPCRELGLMCWEGEGEVGVLEAEELLWDEAPDGDGDTTKTSGQVSLAHTHSPDRSVPRWEGSGVERWPCGGERAHKLCVGEPGRLSLEDRERDREDRLRLVCSRLDCWVILRNKELRFLLRRKQKKRRYDAGVLTEVQVCQQS